MAIFMAGLTTTLGANATLTQRECAAARQRNGCLMPSSCVCHCNLSTFPVYPGTAIPTAASFCIQPIKWCRPCVASSACSAPKSTCAPVIYICLYALDKAKNRVHNLH